MCGSGAHRIPGRAGAAALGGQGRNNVQMRPRSGDTTVAGVVPPARVSGRFYQNPGLCCCCVASDAKLGCSPSCVPSGKGLGSEHAVL